MVFVLDLSWPGIVASGSFSYHVGRLEYYMFRVHSGLGTMQTNNERGKTGAGPPERVCSSESD